MSLAYTIEAWNPTLGTTGSTSWTKYTTGYFGGGATYMVTGTSFLTLNAVDRAANKAGTSLYRCGSQIHFFNTDRCDLAVKVSQGTSSTYSLWADVVFGTTTYAMEMWLDNNGVTTMVAQTSLPSVGTSITVGTLNVWTNAGGTWFIACSGTGGKGTAFSGTSAGYFNSGFGTGVGLVPTVCLNSQGGLGSITYSCWFSEDTPPQHGSWYTEDWGTVYGTGGMYGAWGYISYPGMGAGGVWTTSGGNLHAPSTGSLLAGLALTTGVPPFDFGGFSIRALGQVFQYHVYNQPEAVLTPSILMVGVSYGTMHRYHVLLESQYIGTSRVYVVKQYDYYNNVLTTLSTPPGNTSMSSGSGTLRVHASGSTVTWEDYGLDGKGRPLSVRGSYDFPGDLYNMTPPVPIYGRLGARVERSCWEYEYNPPVDYGTSMRFIYDVLGVIVSLGPNELPNSIERSLCSAYDMCQSTKWRWGDRTSGLYPYCNGTKVRYSLMFNSLYGHQVFGLRFLIQGVPFGTVIWESDLGTKVCTVIPNSWSETEISFHDESHGSMYSSISFVLEEV